jgi:hypothetical protein
MSCRPKASLHRRKSISANASSQPGLAGQRRWRAQANIRFSAELIKAGAFGLLADTLHERAIARLKLQRFVPTLFRTTKMIATRNSHARIAKCRNASAMFRSACWRARRTSQVEFDTTSRRLVAERSNVPIGALRKGEDIAGLQRIRDMRRRLELSWKITAASNGMTSRRFLFEI